MKYIIISAAITLVIIYFGIGEFFWRLKQRSVGQRLKRLTVCVLIVALLASQIDFVNIFTKTDAETVTAAETDVESYTAITAMEISAFSELPNHIREQVVPMGTMLDELLLPDTLEAVCVTTHTVPDELGDTSDDAEEIESEEEMDSEEAEPDEEIDSDEEALDDPAADSEKKTPEDEIDSPSDKVNDAGEDASAEGADGMEADAPTQTPEVGEEVSDGEQSADDATAAGEEPQTEAGVGADIAMQVETGSFTMPEYQTENVIEVKTLEAGTLTIENVTWQSEPEYDGDTEGEYIFTAILPDGYVLTDGVNVPEIIVTVGDNSDKEQTRESFMTGWHFGEEDVYPQGNLFYNEEIYSFVLAGGSSETQIPFEEITDFLPTAVMAEFSYQSTEKENIAVENVEDAQEEVWEEILPIMGWSCPEYVQDEEGYLPYRGKFYFAAMLAEENNCELTEGMTQPGVWVIFDEPMPLAAVTAVPGVISSDQEWGAQTLDAGTYTINPGVTVTVTGCLTVSGNVTIKGGGKIVRGSSSAYFSVSSSGNLTLADIEVDGQSVSSSNSMIKVTSGSVTLDDGCWIHDCTKNSNAGGVLYISSSGKAVFRNVVIENCTATASGGVVYMNSQSIVEVYGGTYKNNATTTIDSNGYGGGFAFNTKGRLYVYGGSFLNNTSKSKAGCIYTSSYEGTETRLYGGYFSGNKSTYTNYEGSGALCYSAMYNYESILQLSGSTQLVGDGEYGTDGLLLDVSSSGTTARKAQISSQLQYPLPVYLKASEGYVIAEGAGYTLQESDMKKISFYDISNSGKTWYAVLDTSNNQIYLSATNPGYGLYVTYNGNGASGAVTDDNKYTSGNTVTLKSNGFTYEGRTFVGWNTKADGTGTSYQPGDKVVITDDLYLYAQWALNVTYNYTANGGTSSTVTSASVATGKNIDLSPTATKAGWEFVGWNTTQNATTKLTSLTMGNAPVTLYAIFKKTLTADFYSGSDNSKETKSVTIYNNETSGAVTAPALDPWSGWTASGWSTSASLYTSSVSANASITLQQNAVYYGVYQKTVTLSYNANGGSSTPSGQSGTRYANVHTTTTYQNPSFTLASAISRIGYTFNGWHKDSASGTASNAGTSVTLTDNTTFYAGWTANTWTVTYEYEGATGGNSMTSQQVTYGSAYGTLPSPTRTGYTFKGWYTRANGSGIGVTSTTQVATDSNHTLYAYWEDKTAPIIGELTYNYTPKTVNGWVIGKDKLVITVPVTEEGSGVSEITYTVTPDGGTARVETAALTGTTNAAIKKATITINADFKGTIKIDCQDAAKNQAASVTVGANLIENAGFDGIIIEDNAPTVSFEIGGNAVSGETGYYDVAPDVKVTVTDDMDNAISGGIASVTYQIGSGSEQSVMGDFTTTIREKHSFTIPSSEISTGIHTITVKVEDNAGNSAGVVLTVKVKGPEETPDASLPEGDDKIGGLVPGAEYDITYTDEDGNEHTDTRTADENGNLEIEDNWTGKNIDITKKGDGAGTTDSPSTSLDIPGRVDEMPEDDITASGESSKGAGNGKIGGLKPGETYQVSNDGGETWEDVVADEDGEIKPLEPGGYDVRKKAEDGKLPSKSVHVDIEKSDIPQEDKPESSIETGNDKIGGLVPGAEYDITYTDEDGNEHTDTRKADENGNLEIEDSWTGKNVGIKKKGNGTDTADSPSSSLDIPGRVPEIPEDDITVSGESSKGAGNGKIGGLKPGETYQVSSDGGETWEDVVADENGEIKSLEPGSYDVRKKAEDGKLPSKSVHVEIKGNNSGDSGSAGNNGGSASNSSGSSSGNGSGSSSGSGSGTGGPGTGNDTSGGTQTGTNTQTGTGTQDEPGDLTGTDKATDTASSGTTGRTGNTGRNPSAASGRTTSSTAEQTAKSADQATDDMARASAKTAQNTDRSEASDRSGRTVHTELKNGEIVINGDTFESNGATIGAEGNSASAATADSGAANGGSARATIATGTIRAAQSATTTLTVGEGSVVVEVVSDEYRYTAGVADTVAVANAVLTQEQKKIVNDGETIEIRVEVKDISEQVTMQDKDTIEEGLKAGKAGLLDLTLGSYVDISMYIRIGYGDWDAITRTGDPIEVVIEIPEELQYDGGTYYIARSHEGKYTLLDDLDNEPDTITIKTELFSTYAIAYKQVLETSVTGTNAATDYFVSHLRTASILWIVCVPVLGILFFLVFWKRRKDEEEQV